MSQTHQDAYVVFIQALPRVWSSLGTAQRRAVRATGREGRAIADRMLYSLSYTEDHDDEDTVSAEELGRFMRGALSRGAAPSSLELRLHAGLLGLFYDKDNARRQEININKAKAVLQALADASHGPLPPRSLAPTLALTHLSLGCVPFTAEIAVDIHQAAPRLASLTIHDNFNGFWDLAAAVPGLSRLLTACCSSLTSLNLKGRLCGFPLPLANAFRACTRLTHITCKMDTGDYRPLEGTPLLTRTMAAMSHLRSLHLSMSIEPRPSGERRAVAAALGSLTQLSHLKLMCFRHCGGSDLLRRVLHPLRHTLTSLHVDLEEVNGSTLRLLASDYSRLTRLTLEPDELHLVRRPPARGGRQAGRGTNGSRGGGTGLGRQPLPPSLEVLRLKTPRPWALDPRTLLALRLPPSLTQLTITGLVACPETLPDCYPRYQQQQEEEGVGADGGASADGGHGSNAAGQAALAAAPTAGAAALQPRTSSRRSGRGRGGALAPAPSACPGFDELLAAVQLMQGRYDTCKHLDLFYNWHLWPCSWPAAADGHVRLFGALKPLGLRQLTLSKCVLQRRDLEVLVDSLPQLEKLGLYCGVHPADLPLVRRLDKLRDIGLLVYLGRSSDAWCADGAVVAALLPLLSGLPDLRRLGVSVLTGRKEAGYTVQEWSDRAEGRERLREAVLGGGGQLREVLRGMGRDPGVLHVHVEQDWELSDNLRQDHKSDSETGTDEDE